MLQRLAGHIADCLGRAADAERLAATTGDPRIQSEYSEIARRWAHLARSYQFVESLERFLLDGQRHRDTPPSEPPDPD
jgi:hypothetical protein